MPWPKCSNPKCDSTSFEASEQSITKLKFKVMLIHCSKCGIAIGVVNNCDVCKQLLTIEKKIDRLIEG